MPSVSGEVSLKEQTKSQVLLASDSIELQKDSKTGSNNFYKLVRNMRKHPTAALARELCIAPILAAEWAIEETEQAPQGAADIIKKNILPLKTHLLRTSLFGCADFGWQPYEKIFKVDAASNYIVVDKLKPLLQDNTTIIVEPTTGAFNGFKNYETMLKLQDSLLVNIRVEGTNWYGESFSQVLQKPFEEWNITNDASVRYDQKLAGAHWVIHYPVGKTEFQGVETDNYDIAVLVLNKLQSSGCVILPKVLKKTGDDLTGSDDGWEIELKSAYPTSDVAFIQKLKYNDALMARAYTLPERAVLEGQFGTKAEAEAHADFAITNMELRHKDMVLIYNWHLINQMLRVNWGEEFENTVFLTVAPITDLNMQFLRTLYTTRLSDATIASAEAQAVDGNALREKLGIPSNPVDNTQPPVNQTQAVAASMLIKFLSSGNE